MGEAGEEGEAAWWLRVKECGHDTSDGRAGGSVRHPNIVVDTLDGLGLRPRLL